MRTYARSALKSNFLFITQNGSRVSVSRKELFAHEILMSMRMKCILCRSSRREKRTMCQLHPTCSGVFVFEEGQQPEDARSYHHNHRTVQMLPKHSFCQTFRNTHTHKLESIEWKFYVTLAAATLIWCHVIARFWDISLSFLPLTPLPRCAYTVHHTCLCVWPLTQQLS